MNNTLINPFAVSHPTAVQTALIAGASFAKYDPTGRYVAAGRPNGSAEIWDLETRAPIRCLDGHVKALTSVDWSRNSRFVLTSGKDWNVIVWDLASPYDPPQRHTTIRFDASIVSASFHPRNSQIILVLMATGEAYVVDLRKEHRSRVELCEPVEDMEEGEEPSQSSRQRSAMTVARFDPSGKHIFVGLSSGTILVFNTRTKTMVARHKIAGGGNMKGLDFAKSGRRLVTNSSDRTLRQFILPNYPSPPRPPSQPNVDNDVEMTERESTFLEAELEPTHRFNDPINKTAWHAMAYSPDGEWLAGGAADAATHKIYIWDISNDGQLASTLDGGRESLLHLHWHPIKSAIASTTIHGNVLLWHYPNPERWGAFAGGFEEVDENVEYEEREDEFDIEDEAVLAQRKMKAEEEEVDVDGGIDTDNESAKKKAALVGAPGDEDNIWADAEPDADGETWTMRVVLGSETTEYT